jgi:hypothetical protein
MLSPILQEIVSEGTGVESKFRPSDGIAAGLWAGGVLGLVEGFVHAVTRLYPLINASLKTSNEIVWITPLVNIPVFLVLGLLAGFFLRLAGHRLKGRGLSLLWAGLSFPAFYLILTTPRVLERFGALILAAGLAVLVYRLMARKLG